jgi:signal transduction histidine kinase
LALAAQRPPLHGSRFDSAELEANGFCVEDSGIGIAESERDKVFRAFVRGKEARGEGLDLSLVKRICEHEGWRIAFEALPQGGSRFR